MVLHSSLSSFVASTRLIRPGVGANDSPDQSRQGFQQYDTAEVLEKVFSVDFLIPRRQKILIFGIFKAYLHSKALLLNGNNFFFLEMDISKKNNFLLLRMCLRRRKL